MHIHLIAIGGSAMHNLALALHTNGHLVTGSDDEIFNPARDRLAAKGLLPEREGWFPEKIHAGIDEIILGMHARADNPELLRARELGLPVYSYPEFLYRHTADKTRAVVAGSHGKTTVTSIILHALRYNHRHFDYLVGAILEGFDTMVGLSDAPVFVAEGDEYLASALDPVPKFLHYRPHVLILTGIAWDHINVFPTFELYVHQFRLLLDSLAPGSRVIWYQPDENLARLMEEMERPVVSIPYGVPKEEFPVSTQLFGDHNRANIQAALLCCRELGLEESDFFHALPSFKGASKRLQVLAERPDFAAYLDFAHAPSKVLATVKAVRGRNPDRRLVAFLELHTFSSLNREFIPLYRGALDAADEAYVFFNPHTLEMKRMPPLEADFIQEQFAHANLEVLTDTAALEAKIKIAGTPGNVVLLMSSGNWGGVRPDFINT